MDDEQAKVLGIEAIEKLTDDELGQLARKAEIKALPEIGKTDDEWQGVVFNDVDFTTIEKPPDFSGFVFPPGSSFARSRFSNMAVFESATFSDWADFRGATFSGWAGFEGATFSGGAVFKGAAFSSMAVFEGATFSDWADFRGATFSDMAVFKDATFRDTANFEGATFSGGADFRGATFSGWARFEGATFRGWAGFDGATFSGGAYFSAHDEIALRSRLKNVAEARELDPAAAAAFVDEGLESRRDDSFHSLSFSGARFRSMADFTGRRFLGPLSLRNTVFDDVPELANTEGAGNIDPSGMQISFQGPIPIPVLRRARGALSWLAEVVLFWPIPERHLHWAADSKVSSRIRRARKIMADIHAHDIERDLFILEKKADRGVLWALGGFRNRWKSVGWTVLLAVYGALSDCGRSLLRPLAWLGATWLGFLWLYRWLGVKAELGMFDPDLMSFTTGNMLPFVSALSPARGKVLERLFGVMNIKIEPVVELASILQSVTGATLLFLLLLAIRSRFKIGG